LNIRQSILGEVAVASGKRIVSVDIASLVRRLLLFDKVIVRSPLLREVDTLVRTFRPSGFKQLLDSGLLRFAVSTTFLIIDVSRNGVRHVPLNHFSFGIGELAEVDLKLREGMTAIQGIPGLNNSERAILEEKILDATLRLPKDYGSELLRQLDHDIRANNPALKLAIQQKLASEIGQQHGPVFSSQECVRVEEVRERVFRIDCPLASLGLSPEKSHAVLHDSIMALANLDQRLADMQTYSAITGFQDQEAPLLFGRLATLMAPLNPAPAEREFERVIEIVDVPDFEPGQKVDVDALLIARESSECREFRGWLTSLSELTDAQIKDMVGGLRAKMGLFVGSTAGRTLRFAATTAVGLLPVAGVVAGPAASAIDSFLIDKLLPRPGVVAFLSKTYPSLFVSA
jgi:hypothetical protein